MEEVWDNGIRLAEYGYNADGTIRSLQCGNLHTEYAYDADRNLTGLKTMMGNEVITDNHYCYDGNGNRVSKQQIYGMTSYAYDSMNRLIRAEYPKEREELFYDGAGNRTSIVPITMRMVIGMVYGMDHLHQDIIIFLHNKEN